MFQKIPGSGLTLPHSLGLLTHTRNPCRITTASVWFMMSCISNRPSRSGLVFLRMTPVRSSPIWKTTCSGASRRYEYSLCFVAREFLPSLTRTYFWCQFRGILMMEVWSRLKQRDSHLWRSPLYQTSMFMTRITTSYSLEKGNCITTSLMAGKVVLTLQAWK